MLLVYTHKITPRLRYTFKQVCTRILNIEVDSTTIIETFIAHDGIKMSYTNQPLGNEFFIKSHELLFEQGLSDIEIKVSDWENTKCFFPNGERSQLPYDIFAASFFLLSRYEEYLPHVKDEYGRFLAEESLAYKNQFLEFPVVDIWSVKFKNALAQKFPDYKFPKIAYRVIPVIDVPMVFYYKKKGLLRMFGGFVSDLGRFKFKSFYQRFLVILGIKEDPYNTFKWLIGKQKEFNQKFIVLFLIGAYSNFDKNISINRKAFVTLIKYVADYCSVGLKSSYNALTNSIILKEEKLKLEGIIHVEVKYNRNSFSKVNLPESYRQLVEQEIPEDYSMGYVNHIGFRAGTCSPFLFYDLDYDSVTPLKVVPYSILDFALLKFQSLLDKKEKLEEIKQRVKEVNGTFVPVFHNYTFSDHERWEGFKELFDISLK